jgi:hypothetical protein
LLALGCLFLDASPGAAQVSKEYQVKAVFLFRFTQFVKWPLQAFPTAQSPIVLGVLGENPFGDALELAVRGETVNGRSLNVKEFKDVKETGDCQVLFISRSETAHLPGIFDALKGRSVLTVGDDDSFSDRGGMIQFVTEGNRVRFKINRKAAEAAQLKLSSKLLRLAE